MHTLRLSEDSLNCILKKLNESTAIEQTVENLTYVLEEKFSVQPNNQYILDKINQMKNERNLIKQHEILAQVIPLIRNITVAPVEPIIEKIESSQKEMLKEIRTIGEKLDNVIISLEPGVSEELILHLGYITSVGGVEYTLTVPLQELSYSDIKEELKEIEGKRISQLCTMPPKIAKVVEDFLVKNKMEDLLKKLR